MAKRVIAPRMKHQSAADGNRLHGSLDVGRLAAEQGVGPVHELGNLRLESWPDDEKVDDFIELIYRWRREDR